MKSSLLAVAAVLSAGCAPSFILYPNARAEVSNQVVLLQRTELRFLIDPETGAAVADLTEEKRTAVRGPWGEDLEPTRIVYNRKSSPLLELSASTVDPTGMVWPRDTEPAFRASWEPFESDRRELTMLSPFVTAGSIYQVQSTRRFRDLDLVRFDTEPVGRALDARLEVIVPEGWEIAWVTHDGEQRIAYAPRIVRGEEGTRYIWQRDPRRELSPRAQIQVRAVRVNDRGQWRELPKSYEQVAARLRERMLLETAKGPRLAALTDVLISAPSAAPERAARNAYDWVNQKVALDPTAFGTHNWRPRSLDAVIELERGDAKDKAVLLAALLDRVGIPCELLALQNSGAETRPFELPALSRDFDRLILRIQLPGGAVLVDPALPGTPFGALPQSEQGAIALPLMATGSGLERTPHEDNTKDSETVLVTFTLDPKGELSGRSVVTSRGRLAQERLAELERANAVERARLFDAWSGLKRPLGVDFENVSAPPASADLEVSLVFSPSAAVQSSSWTSWLKLNWFASEWLSPGTLDRAVTVLPTRDAVFRIPLPARVQVTALPTPSVIESPLGRYELTWAREGSELIATRRLRLKSRMLIPADQDDLKKFAAQVRSVEKRRPEVKF